MELFIKFFTLWLSTSIVVISTMWYVTSLVKPRWPGWWERHIAAEEIN